mgnify:CR=1 FL=1
MKNTLIISAYTCCGKTYASKHMKDYDILDVNICNFKTIKRLPNEEEIEKERKRWDSSLHLMSVERHLNQFKQQIISVNNPDFPNNFIQCIKKNIGKVDVIFVDSDIRIRQWLNEAKIKFVTIYPWNNCLEEWIGRMYLQDYPDIIIRNKINGWYHETYPVKEPYGDQLVRFPSGKYISERLIDDCFILGYGVNGGLEYESNSK